MMVVGDTAAFVRMMAMVVVPVMHRVSPVEPDEIGGKRAEGEVEPKGIVEAEARYFGADIRGRVAAPSLSRYRPRP
jgi:hypothetical protein